MATKVTAVNGTAFGPSVAFESPPADGCSEKEFQARVVRFAESQGWLVFHPHDSRRSKEGFPDLVLVRERVIFAELKVGNNSPTRAQREWLDAIAKTGRTETVAFLWYPDAWPIIVEILRRR